MKMPVEKLWMDCGNPTSPWNGRTFPQVSTGYPQDFHRFTHRLSALFLCDLQGFRKVFHIISTNNRIPILLYCL